MNSVERVKRICKERKIPISKLERDLGFANGYISQLRKGTFPGDRLRSIADYLSVGIEYLLTGSDKSEIGVSDYELKRALFGEDANCVSDDLLNDVKLYAQYLNERRKNRNTDSIR